MDEKKSITVGVHVEMADVEAAIEKVERLNRLLREAKSLINELASRGASSVIITPTSVYTTVGSGSSGCIGGWQTGADPSNLRGGQSTGKPTFPENLQGQI